MKNRKTKALEYEQLYSHIPIDYAERLAYLYDTLHITEEESWEILEIRRKLISGLWYNDVNVVLYEVPEGSPRPRARLVRSNLSAMAKAYPGFIQVYSITGREDNLYMKRMVEDHEFYGLDQIICTPCNVDINAYLRTPKYYNRKDTILAEIGIHRPLTKPDWDNIEKKYSDMFNKNVWLDDNLVVDGAIHRYYSVLPRIEIRLRFLNHLYTRQQYNAMINRVDFDPTTMSVSYIPQERIVLPDGTV